TDDVPLARALISLRKSTKEAGTDPGRPRAIPIVEKGYALRMEHADFPDLAEESRHIWDENAGWWDAKMGEGNDWHRLLIAPAVEQLLELQGGERVLEMACGNGQFARHLAFLGARVV